MKQFRLKEEFIVSITEQKPITIKLIETGETLNGTSFGSIDHPKFTDLRNRLEKLGYIQVERKWWNGDKALKAFKLNRMTFKKGDQFPCASALSVRILVDKKNKKKKHAKS